MLVKIHPHDEDTQVFRACISDHSKLLAEDSGGAAVAPWLPRSVHWSRGITRNWIGADRDNS